jgi:NAD(P)-dependent dehydrogenase (short-subunit alcohol dehydrogenase family)
MGKAWRAGITVRAEVDAAYTEALRRFGAIDILLNNAGQAIAVAGSEVM